jgi:hypothetical protein
MEVVESQMGVSEIVVDVGGWGQAVLEASLTVVGLIVTQTIVIRLFQRSESKRLDPFVVQCCAEFSSALGQVKMQLRDRAPLSAIIDYKSTFERLSLIGPDEIHVVMERVQSDIFSCIRHQASGDEEQFQESLSSLFQDQMNFTQVARRHLGQKEKRHRATPMIDSETLAEYAKSIRKT